MKDIRLKPEVKKPKVLEKAKRLPRNTNKSIENMRSKAKQIDTKDVHGTPENYATDQVTDKASGIVQRAGQKVASGSKQVVKRGGQEVRKRLRYSAQRTGHETVKKSTKGMIKTARKSAKGTVKMVNKGVKTAKHTVKATKRTIKTSARAAKATAKATRVSAKIAIRTAQAAAKAAATAVKVLAKAAAAAVKAIAVAVKSLVAAIAAGGWVVLVIVIVIGAILFIINSAFGLFYSNEEDGDPNTVLMTQAVIEINSDFSSYIDQKVSAASAGHENVTVVYEGGIDGDSDNVNNWVDVLGVYAVKMTTDETQPMQVATVSEDKKQILKGLYWEMNTVSIRTETVEIPDPDDEEADPIVETTVYVCVASETYADAAERYVFTEDQKEMLEELMNPEYHHMFIALIGVDCYGGLTPREIEEIRNGLPDDVGGDVVRYALTRLGDPYSQAKRGVGNYVDCSYLVRWAHNQAGITSYKAATAAEQARYCVNNDMLVSRDQLRPGDVIFWRKNGCNCGRYKEIHHVAIYIGDGMIIEASSSRGCVVINELWGEGSGGRWTVLYYGRPSI